MWNVAGPNCPSNGFGLVIPWDDVNENTNLSEYTTFDWLNLHVETHREQLLLNCGGPLGATPSTTIGYSYTINFTQMWNYTTTPEVKLEYINGVSMIFYCGDERFWTDLSLKLGVGNTLVAGIPISRRYLYAPVVELEVGNKIFDPNNFKFIRQQVKAHVRTHILLSPDQGTLFDTDTKMGAYAYALNNGAIVY